MRIKEGKCLTCGKIIYKHLKYCNKECWKHKPMPFSTRLKSQTREVDIRWHARQILNKFVKDKKCIVCGYAFYVEACHIKPVGEFSPNTTLAVINDISNLMYLCPNHHVELDKGKLKF